MGRKCFTEDCTLASPGLDDKDVFSAFKSRRIGWAGHIECMGKKQNTYKVLVGKSEDLKLILKKLDGRAYTGLMWPCAAC